MRFYSYHTLMSALINKELCVELSVRLRVEEGHSVAVQEVTLFSSGNKFVQSLRGSTCLSFFE